MRKNVGKTVGMVCRPCQAAGNQSEATYERRMTGEVLSYRERQHVRVKCSECGEDMALGFLEVQLQTNHGKVTGGIRHWVTRYPVRDPHT